MGKLLNRNTASRKAVCLEMTSKRPLRGGSILLTAWPRSKLSTFVPALLSFISLGADQTLLPEIPQLSWAELVAMGRVGTVHPCSYHAFEVPG